MTEVEYPDEFEPECDEDDYDDDPCQRCGPWCEHWMGDGLCEVACEELAREEKEFEEKYKSTRLCPVCNQRLTCYQIPEVDELWHWPGKWNPMIGLGIFAAYGVPKGELHHKGNIYHVWIGAGDYRDEKLIQPLGKEAKIATFL